MSPIDQGVLRRAVDLLQRNDLAPTAADSTVSCARALREWLEDPEILRPPNVVIPHLAVEGRTTLLSGREKIGKSTLAAGALSAASRGDEVFGVQLVNPVTSLWYALDEPVADAVRRFDVLGANVDRITLNAAPRTVSELLTALTLDLATFASVGVVVVDTLSRILAGSGVDPNSSREVEPVIANLVEVFHRHNVAAILLYHTGKAGREYRGSTAIGATVDEVLTLRRRGQSDDDDFDEDSADDGRRLLVQDGRNLRGRIHLTCRDGMYRLYDEAYPPRDRIVQALRDNGTVAGRGELTKLAGVRKAAGLSAIAGLIGEGVIIEDRRRLKLAAAVPKTLWTSAQTATREPPTNTAGFPGSDRFQQNGTTSELRGELAPNNPRESGSPSGAQPSADPGTTPPRNA
jgi:hypothetical protein